MRLKIAMLAPIWERVPPPAYGGIELVVSLLTEGLLANGHDVTLFATGDSQTQGSLDAVHARPLRERGIPWSGSCYPELIHVRHCFRRAAEFDLIHNHLGYHALAVAPYVDTPVVTTLHGPFEADNTSLYAHFQDLPYVSISDAQRRGAPDGMNFVGTVYNGIDTQRFALADKRGYLLNLGRISPEKGTHLAIEAARRMNKPLIIAGKVDPFDQAYYESAIRPHIDGHLVRYIGEVGGQRKADLLAQADALLHPVQWPEPFGLVMPEAMAAGTPVIAYPMGSIPEVVDHGVSGFIVDSVPAMCEAIARLDRLEPATCRRQAIARFDARRMTADYEAVYAQLLEPSAQIVYAPPRHRRVPFRLGHWTGHDPA